MTNPDDAAHPVPPENIGPSGELCQVREHGLTKRELFAAMAMQGLLAQPDERVCPKDRMADSASWIKEVRLNDAEWCVGMADDLIAALNESLPK
jgi:hypothetical protein